MITENKFGPKKKLGLVPAVRAAQATGLDGTPIVNNLTPVRDNSKQFPVPDPAPVPVRDNSKQFPIPDPMPVPTPVRDSGKQFPLPDPMPVPTPVRDTSKQFPLPDPADPNPVIQNPVMSTGTPADPVTGTQQPTIPATAGSLGLDFMRQVTPNELVANQLDALLSNESPYIKNARMRGKEFAASRGNINSSIAAGASQRAALEAAMPIAQADADVYRQANQGNFESLNELRKMRTAAELDDWLSSGNYNREFNGNLAMLQINSGADMLAYITQRALEDPAVYTPDVISGFNNFFNLNMKDMFKNFFGGGGKP